MKLRPSSFSAPLNIIGINPFVHIPAKVLNNIFLQAEKDKGPIPVCGKVNKKPYRQTLVRYRGDWRLYINTLMLKDSPKRVGEKVNITIAFDPADRSLVTPSSLTKALQLNPVAKKNFEALTPSRKKEIVRYIANLKTKSSIERNVSRAIEFLSGKGRFVGRDAS